MLSEQEKIYRQETIFGGTTDDVLSEIHDTFGKSTTGIADYILSSLSNAQAEYDLGNPVLSNQMINRAKFAADLLKKLEYERVANR